jgi:thioredoxin reductase (NADPH)
LGAKNVSVIGSSKAIEIRGTNNSVSSIVIDKAGSREEIKTDAVFVAIGVNPNTEIFRGILDLDDVGYIKSFGGSKTSKEGVFWAGDVGHSQYQQAIVAAGEGCVAALDAADFLGEHK